MNENERDIMICDQAGKCPVKISECLHRGKHVWSEYNPCNTEKTKCRKGKCIARCMKKGTIKQTLIC